MRKIFSFFFCGAVFLTSACSTDKSEKAKTDSTKTVADSSVVQLESRDSSIKTDSGRLEIRLVTGVKESDAFLYGENGKIKQKGQFLHGKPAGAWVKYDDAGNVLSAYHYSNGVPARKLDTQDFNFVTCAKKGFGATFSVPKNWPETPSPEPDHLVAFSKDLKDPAITLNPNFNFRHEKLHPGDNLESLTKMQLGVLHENVGRIEMIDQSDLLIDSCRATRNYGLFSDESGTVGFLSAIIISGDDVWFLSCEALNNKAGDFLAYQGVFDAILDSFKRVK